PFPVGITDLQAWIRNDNIAPDWSRVGADIVGGGLTFNMTFSLAGVAVTLDVHPGACPNPVNRKSHGVLPVALVGSAEIALSSIDVSSFRLCRVDGVGGCVSPLEGPPGPHSVLADVAAPSSASGCDCQVTQPDGIQDLVLFFSIPEVV